MKRTITLLVVTTLLLAACGKPNDTFVGTWTGKLAMTAEQEEKMKEAMGEEGLRSFMNSAGTEPLVIELHGDKTSEMLWSSQNIDGEWELSEDGEKITVKADESPNTVTMDVILLVSEDGRSLTWDMTLGIMDVSFVFTK